METLSMPPPAYSVRKGPLPPYTPPALQLPEQFVVGATTTAPVVHITELRDHLRLLNLFNSLRLAVGSEPDAWPQFVCGAAVRFNGWVESLAREAYRQPTLDVAMVWHAFMLVCKHGYNYSSLLNADSGSLEPRVVRKRCASDPRTRCSRVRSPKPALVSRYTLSSHCIVVAVHILSQF